MLDGPALYDRVMRGWLIAGGARSRRVRYRFSDELHVLDLPGRGALPPVVLVHGFSASGASQYGPLVMGLRDRVTRIFLPDLPGHGGSSVPASGLDAPAMIDGLTAAVDELLDEPAVMFASSMAGGVAVHVALRRPDALRGLMLCSPSGAPFAPDQAEKFARVFRVQSHEDALAFVDRLSPHPWWKRHAYAWGIRQAFSRPHLVKLLDDVPTMRFLEPDELAALSIPVHLVWGRADEVLPASQLDFYRAHLPRTATIETPHQFGHAPFLDHAEELTQLFLGFVRRVAG